MSSSGRRASSGVEAIVWGIGSELRGDDGIGVWVARAMARLLRDEGRVLVRACGLSPESYAPEVVRLRPRLLLVVDAAEVGLEPGGTKLLDPSLLVEEEVLLLHGLPTAQVLRWVLPFVGRSWSWGFSRGRWGSSSASPGGSRDRGRRSSGRPCPSSGVSFAVKARGDPGRGGQGQAWHTA